MSALNDEQQQPGYITMSKMRNTNEFDTQNLRRGYISLNSAALALYDQNAFI